MGVRFIFIIITNLAAQKERSIEKLGVQYFLNSPRTLMRAR